MILPSLPMVKWRQARWSCSRGEIGIHPIVPRVSPDGTQRRSLNTIMVLVVSDKLTVATVIQAKTRLMVALESGENLELDARGVSEVDVAGLQVLLAAKREAEARGNTLSLPASSCSEPLVQALALAGLTDALNQQRPEIAHG